MYFVLDTRVVLSYIFPIDNVFHLNKYLTGVGSVTSTRPVDRAVVNDSAAVRRARVVRR